MDKTEAAEKITALRTAMGLSALADKLGVSKGHAIDLCKARRGVSRSIAERLESVTGRPWHEWIPPAPEPRSEPREAAQ